MLASGPIRILGIDPGSRITGYGIIDSDGRRSVHVASGCIRTADSGLPARLQVIFRGVQQLMAQYRPAAVAVEQVFMARNAFNLDYTAERNEGVKFSDIKDVHAAVKLN